ncbi:Calmodulin-binding domain [Theobroma cacao]|nr:Calmodulin-binding domain [Theobroma cacao]
MISTKVVDEADADNFMESETLSTTTESSFENQNGRNRGRAEPGKKMKKLRSIKLSRMPSTRKGRSSSSQLRTVLSGYAASSEQSTPIEMSDASPNHIDPTSSSDAKEENFQAIVQKPNISSCGQELQLTLTRRSSFKPVRAVTRKSSMKLRRPQLRKSSGGTDLKKKSQSIRPASFESSNSSRRDVSFQDDQHPIIPSSEVDSAPHYLESTSSCDMKKEQLQASPSHSESSFDSSDQNKKISTNEKQKLAYPGNESNRVLRTCALGPMRRLTKMASLKSKRPSTKKCSEISSISDPSIERATCSSTLKDSKFPDRVEIKPGGSESDGNAVLNVCRYSYCSLHGHNHGNKPPLKRLVSMRRRVAKTQKSLKPHRQSSGKAKHSGKKKKGLQTEKGVFNGDPGVAVQQTTVDIQEIPSVTGKEGSNFVNLAGSVPGELLYPDSSNEENLHQNNNPIKVEFKEISVDCSGVGAEQHKENFDTPDTKTKIEEIGHPNCRDVSSEEFGDATQLDKLSLRPDKTISTCNQVVPVDEEAHRDVDEDKASSLNLEEYKGDLGKDVKKLETVSTGRSFELPNGLFSLASVSGMMEEPTSASEEKNGDSELDHGILEAADSTAASTTDAACKTDKENQKNFTFWKLIYQHMVTGLDAEFETQKPLPGVNLKEQVENLHNACENKDSCQEISQTDQAMSIEDHEARNRKIEFSQSDAIKLVQQAFDKILSEIPDHSSDDQLVASEITSDEDFLLTKQDEGKEASISISSDSIEDCMVQDHEEKQLQTDNKVASEEVKVAQIEGKKSDKQMPNSWSNLKKIIILKRFVKSLEKVRNLKPRKSWNLPMNRDPEAEKIHLRHQNMKGRKNTEEWMLDHALRQVISTMAPSQKRKVAMLVQAFETIIPLPENGNDMRSNAAASSPTTSVQAHIESLVHNGDSVQNENGSEILPGKSSYPQMSFKDDHNQVNESQMAHQEIQKASPEPKVTSLLCGCTEQSLCIAASQMSGTDMMKEDTGAVDDNDGKDVSISMDAQPKFVDLSLSELEEHRLSDKSLNNEDAVRISHEKFFPENEEVIQKISKDEISILDSEVSNGGSEFNVQKKDLESSDLINSADQHPGKPESQTEVGEGAQPKYKFLSYPLAQFESNFAADVSKSERQKYMRLWYLIYKHMVSGSATEDGSQPLHSGADEEVQGDAASKFSIEKNADCQGSFAVGQDMMENYTTGSQNIECHNHEIIKLVEEAIDEIPLPDIQDDTSDNQSVTGDAIPDQVLSEKKHGEEVHIISSSTGSAEEDSEEARNITTEVRSTLNSEEKTLKSKNVSSQKEATRETEEGNKSKKRVQRNWSNLKKLILLRRFVKALEKVREFNPRAPQYLPLDPAPESEKVLLRHQNMEDRRNAEEWMLDYALQKVVAKLTPERKRRVELLVEAFETVIPTIS